MPAGMTIPSEKSVSADADPDTVPGNTHERPGQEWNPAERDNVISLALRANGQERGSVEWHADEDDQEPLESPYAPKKEPARPVVDADFAEDAPHRTSERRSERVERRAIDTYEPILSDDERLTASVRSIQREAAALRLPRAAQLGSVPGPSIVENGFWPSRSPEPEELALSPAMRSRPDNLRGPLTAIKIITLIVSTFAVPAAYYFWVGGWDPISSPPRERALLVSNSAVPPPNAPDQAAVTSARGDDSSTLAKAEPGAAKSFADKTVATLQPGTPGAQDPPLSTAVRALDPEKIKLLTKRGEQFIAAGDVVTARIAFQRAAEAGDANAAIALGATYDPTVLARFGVVGITADVSEARSWYRKAEKLGSPEATRRLELLADR
jgi:TPR repeat protein